MIIRRHALTISHDSNQAYTFSSDRNTVKFRNKPWGFYFSKALFEGHIFGGAYVRWEICVSKSIGRALELGGDLPFLLCFALYLRVISKHKPPGGLIFGGAYFRNFTVYQDNYKHWQRKALEDQGEDGH